MLPRAMDKGRSPSGGNTNALFAGSFSSSGLNTVCVRHPTDAKMNESSGKLSFFDSMTLGNVITITC